MLKGFAARQMSASKSPVCGGRGVDLFIGGCPPLEELFFSFERDEFKHSSLPTCLFRDFLAWNSVLRSQIL